MSAPKRIQRRRTKGWRLPPDAIYVGRPSLWGNPFTVRSVGPPAPRPATHEEAVDMFRRAAALWCREMWAPVWLEPLRGHDLACWCHLCDAHADGLPLGVTCPDCAPCHADALLELANR